MKQNKSCNHYWEINPGSISALYKLKENLICFSCGKTKEVEFSDPLLDKIRKRYIKENLNPKLKFKEARRNQ